MTTRKRILLVDSDLPVREALHHALTLANYDVTAAATGREAIRWFSKGAADLVVLDLSPTTEIDWSLSRWLSESKPDVPVIAIASQTYDTAPNLPAGVDVWFEKPFDIALLIQTSQTLLARSEESQHGRIAATTRALKNIQEDKGVRSDAPKVEEVLRSI